MSLQLILKEIKDLENQTGRTAVFLYGSAKKLTTAHHKSKLNRIGPYEYECIKNALSNGSYLPKLKQNHVDLIISSPGGRVAFAIAIMRLMHNKFGGVNVVVPTMAGSSAALMSFSGSKLYVGVGAQTSDFWHQNGNLAPVQLQALITATYQILATGNVVQKKDIPSFVLFNNTIQKISGHGPIPYSSFINICTQLGVTLTVQDLISIDNHDPQFPTPGVSKAYIDVDIAIRSYMNQNGLASLVLVSDFFNMATN